MGSRLNGYHDGKPARRITDAFSILATSCFAPSSHHASGNAWRRYSTFLRSTGADHAFLLLSHRRFGIPRHLSTIQIGARIRSLLIWGSNSICTLSDIRTAPNEATGDLQSRA